jgi:hypothetical protein
VWLVLFLDADAMGAFAVAAFFWSPVPNPAIAAHAHTCTSVPLFQDRPMGVVESERAN